MGSISNVVMLFTWLVGELVVRLYWFVMLSYYFLSLRMRWGMHTMDGVILGRFSCVLCIVTIL